MRELASVFLRWRKAAFATSIRCGPISAVTLGLFRPQRYDCGKHFRLGNKRVWRHAEVHFYLREVLAHDGKEAVVAISRACGDTFCNFELEHESHIFDRGLVVQVSLNDRGGNIVWKVAHHPEGLGMRQTRQKILLSLRTENVSMYDLRRCEFRQCLLESLNAIPVNFHCDQTGDPRTKNTRQCSSSGTDFQKDIVPLGSDEPNQALQDGCIPKKMLAKAPFGSRFHLT